MESSRRRIPRADSGRFTARITEMTTIGRASRAPIEIMVVAVVFWAGRPSLPARSNPIPQPTAVCVIASRLVCTVSDDFDMMLAICNGRAKRKPEN
jgi:hypothetical protein